MLEQRTSVIFLFFVLALTQVSSEVFFKKGSPHVKLNNNAVISGSMDYSREGRPFSSFMGIPYATIPSRFEESQLVAYPTWDDGSVKSFTEPGNVCSQLYFDGSMLGKEDCLNLNIFVPMNNTGDRRGYPVMIWIHGGGFILGNSYGNGPKYFMDEDVIMISFNYRLGVFGFLSTGDNIVVGNNAMKDMVILLKWVQEHVSKFGGNREKVTIFGESAGSAAVHYLTLSPLTKGLFHRAISQSASGTVLLATDPDPKANAVQLATHLKCPTTAEEPSGITSEEILACLKDLPEEELNKAQFQYRQCWPPLVRPFFFPPIAEPEGTPNAFLTESPVVILADKNRPLRDVPWLIGANEDEGATMYAGIVVENPELLEQLNKEWDTVAPLAFDYGRFPLTSEEKQTISNKIRQFYFGSETEPITLEKHRKNLTNLFSDQLITHSVHKAAVETAARNKRGPVYLYQFAYPGPLSMMGLIFKLKGEETKSMVPNLFLILNLLRLKLS